MALGVTATSIALVVAWVGLAVDDPCHREFALFVSDGYFLEAATRNTFNAWELAGEIVVKHGPHAAFDFFRTVEVLGLHVIPRFVTRWVYAALPT